MKTPAAFVLARRGETASQLKVLVLQLTEIRLSRAGRNPLQGVIAEGAAAGAGGHDALFVAHHLTVVQGAAAGAVGAAGVNVLLKQGHERASFS